VILFSEQNLIKIKFVSLSFVKACMLFFAFKTHSVRRYVQLLAFYGESNGTQIIR